MGHAGIHVSFGTLGDTKGHSVFRITKVSFTGTLTNRNLKERGIQPQVRALLGKPGSGGMDHFWFLIDNKAVKTLAHSRKIKL